VFVGRFAVGCGARRHPPQASSGRRLLAAQWRPAPPVGLIAMPGRWYIKGLTASIRTEEDPAMAHTFEDLKHKTVAELREIAKGIEHEAVQGATQMNKDHLLKGLCTALGLEMHAHHHVEGIDKAAIKVRIRELQKRRDELLAASDKKELPAVLRQIHNFKKRIRRATV
jgi:hypothetical protein